MPSGFLIEFKLANLSAQSIVKWTQDLLQVYKSVPSENAKQDLLRICTRKTHAFASTYEKGNSYENLSDTVLKQFIKICEKIKDHGLLLNIAEGFKGRRLRQALCGAFSETLHAFSFSELQPW